MKAELDKISIDTERLCTGIALLHSNCTSAKVQPWVQLGISRRTYYYHKKKGLK